MTFEFKLLVLICAISTLWFRQPVARGESRVARFRRAPPCTHPQWAAVLPDPSQIIRPTILRRRLATIWIPPMLSLRRRALRRHHLQPFPPSSTCPDSSSNQPVSSSASAVSIPERQLAANRGWLRMLNAETIVVASACLSWNAFVAVGRLQQWLVARWAPKALALRCCAAMHRCAIKSCYHVSLFMCCSAAKCRSFCAFNHWYWKVYILADYLFECLLLGVSCGFLAEFRLDQIWRVSLLF